MTLRARLRAEGLPVDDTTPPEAGGAEGDTTDEATPARLSAEERAQVLETLRAKQATLGSLQGERPLILPSVDRIAVGGVVQDWTGIPAGRMLASQAEQALSLATILSQRSCRAGSRDADDRQPHSDLTRRPWCPRKARGRLHACRPLPASARPETALALAETLFGGEQNLISINMSEFQEAHTVSTLKGAPPGYVGYGKGGILTEAVRRRPYSVVLLDEVEKAHPDVHEIFFQVFDKGMMDDSEGRRIDFKNCLILLTTNVGSEEIMAMTDEGKGTADLEDLTASLRAPMLKTFPAALLGRIVSIPYYPLSDAMIEAIAGHKLRGIAKRLLKGHEAELVIGAGVMDQIKARCTELESGGRMIDAILTNTLLPELSRQVLNRKLEGSALTKVTVTGTPDGFAYAFE